MLILCTTLSAFAMASIPASAQKATSDKDKEAKLIAVLKSDANRKAKADACRELARVGTHEAVAPLAALLGDEELSHMARYGLEPIPDPAVDDALRDALGKLKGRALVGVIGSIGVRRDLKAVDPLVKRLGDEDREVAQASARALGRIGTVDAARALEKSLASGPAANRGAVCEGLLRSAEILRSQGQRAEARAIYEAIQNADVPSYIKEGASRAEGALQRPADAPRRGRATS
jgi:HEAT repeat protein